MRVEPFAGAIAVSRVQFIGRGIAPEIVRKRRAFPAQALELRLALGDQVILVTVGDCLRLAFSSDIVPSLARG